jgi:hypothetical protein
MLAMPRLLTSILIESDWYIDAETGITIYEFERATPGLAPYKMLHLVMDVKRQMPFKSLRPPRVRLAPEVKEAYHTVVRQIFTKSEVLVTLENIDQDALQENLNQIIEQIRLYCPNDE